MAQQQPAQDNTMMLVAIAAIGGAAWYITRPQPDGDDEFGIKYPIKEDMANAIIPLDIPNEWEIREKEKHDELHRKATEELNEKLLHDMEIKQQEYNDRAEHDAAFQEAQEFQDRMLVISKQQNM